jgi:hypothetical protein
MFCLSCLWSYHPSNRYIRWRAHVMKLFICSFLQVHITSYYIHSPVGCLIYCKIKPSVLYILTVLLVCLSYHPIWSWVCLTKPKVVNYSSLMILLNNLSVSLHILLTLLTKNVIACHC